MRVTSGNPTTDKVVFLKFIRIKLESGSVGFLMEREKLEYPEEIPWSKEKNQQQALTTYDIKSGITADLAPTPVHL